MPLVKLAHALRGGLVLFLLLLVRLAIGLVSKLVRCLGAGLEAISGNVLAEAVGALGLVLTEVVTALVQEGVVLLLLLEIAVNRSQVASGLDVETVQNVLDGLWVGKVEGCRAVVELNVLDGKTGPISEFLATDAKDFYIETTGDTIGLFTSDAIDQKRTYRRTYIIIINMIRVRRLRTVVATGSGVYAVVLE